MLGTCGLSYKDYLITDWQMYSIFVRKNYEAKNEKLDLVRRILFEIRTNNVYLKATSRPTSLDDIYKLVPYTEVGKRKKKVKYKKPDRKLVESAKKFGINIVG